MANPRQLSGLNYVLSGPFPSHPVVLSQILALPTIFITILIIYILGNYSSNICILSQNFKLSEGERYIYIIQQ